MKKEKVKKPSSTIFKDMELVPNENSYVDNKKHIYFNLWWRLGFRFVSIFVLFVVAYVLYNFSFSEDVLVSIDYNEYGTVNEKVSFKENDFYDENYDTTQYVTSVIDNINTNFYYNFNLNKPMSYMYSYSVDAILYIDSLDSKNNLYKKEYNLLDRKEEKVVEGTGINISEDVVIDYDTYNKVAKDFKASYGLNTASRLDVIMSIKFIGDSEVFINNKVKDTKLVMSVPLNEHEVSIKKSDISNKGAFSEKINSSLVNDVSIAVLYICLIVIIMMIMETVAYIVRIIPKKNKYCITRDKYIKNYSSVVIVLKKDYDMADKQIVDCDSFDDLFDAQQTSENPILFREIAKNQKGMFIVDSGDTIYRYVLKDCDL